MHNIVVRLLIVVLIVFNALLLWQNWSLARRVEILSQNNRSEEKSSMAGNDTLQVDLRGLYAVPGIGAYLLPKNEKGEPQRAPLSLAIFFSAKTNCPMNLSEIEVFKRLKPILEKRRQNMVAVSSSGDSLNIQHLLDSSGLSIPLVAIDADSGASLDQMGISPLLMPFKVIYDSTFTAIYMRAADNQLKSQTDFEKAMMRLSDLAYAP